MIISGESKLIAAAFVKARGEMNATVAKDARGNYGKYATLAAIVEATSAAFAKYGLAIVQEVMTAEGGVTVETWLIHESGATMQFAPLTMPLAQRTAQAVGSATTYARRYQLASVCGLAPDDDDGQAATDAQRKSPVQHRNVNTATGEIGSDDNPFDDEQQPTLTGDQPTPDELDIISTWRGPLDAQMWAMKIGACQNEHHARESWVKSVKANGGYSPANKAAVYLHFLKHQNEKLSADEPVKQAA